MVDYIQSQTFSGEKNCVFSGIHRNKTVEYLIYDNKKSYKRDSMTGIVSLFMDDFSDAFPKQYLHKPLVENKTLVAKLLEKANFECKDAVSDKNADVIIRESKGIQSLSDWIIDQDDSIDPRVIQSIFFQIVWSLYASHTVYGFSHNDLNQDTIYIDIHKGPSVKKRIKIANDVFELEIQNDDPIIIFHDVSNATYHGFPTRDKKNYLYFEPPEKQHSTMSDLWNVGLVMLSIICHKRWIIPNNGIYNFDGKEDNPHMFREGTGREWLIEQYQLLQQSIDGENNIGFDAAIEDSLGTYGKSLMRKIFKSDPNERKNGYGYFAYLFHPYFTASEIYIGKNTIRKVPANFSTPAYLKDDDFKNEFVQERLKRVRTVYESDAESLHQYTQPLWNCVNDFKKELCQNLVRNILLILRPSQLKIFESLDYDPNFDEYSLYLLLFLIYTDIPDVENIRNFISARDDQSELDRYMRTFIDDESYKNQLTSIEFRIPPEKLNLTEEMTKLYQQNFGEISSIVETPELTEDIWFDNFRAAAFLKSLQLDLDLTKRLPYAFMAQVKI